MLSKYYRNRITMVEALQQSMGFLHYLYYSAVQESKTAAGKTEQENQAMADMLGV